MFGLGYAEMMIVGVVAVLLFGGRLPQVARSMGRSLTEFKKGMQDLQSDVTDAIHSEPTGNVGYNPAPVDYDQEPSAPKFQPPTSPPAAEAEAAETGTSD